MEVYFDSVYPRRDTNAEPILVAPREGIVHWLKTMCVEDVLVYNSRESTMQTVPAYLAAYKRDTARSDDYAKNVVPLVVYFLNKQYIIGQADLNPDPKIAVLTPGTEFASRIAYLLNVEVGVEIPFVLPNRLVKPNQIVLGFTAPIRKLEDLIQ